MLQGNIVIILMLPVPLPPVYLLSLIGEPKLKRKEERGGGKKE